MQSSNQTITGKLSQDVNRANPYSAAVKQEEMVTVKSLTDTDVVENH